jgi:hypothetical protein
MLMSSSPISREHSPSTRSSLASRSSSNRLSRTSALGSPAAFYGERSEPMEWRVLFVGAEILHASNRVTLSILRSRCRTHSRRALPCGNERIARNKSPRLTHRATGEFFLDLSAGVTEPENAHDSKLRFWPISCVARRSLIGSDRSLARTYEARLLKMAQRAEIARLSRTPRSQELCGLLNEALGNLSLPCVWSRDLCHASPVSVRRFHFSRTVLLFERFEPVPWRLERSPLRSRRDPDKLSLSSLRSLAGVPPVFGPCVFADARATRLPCLRRK